MRRMELMPGGVDGMGQPREQAGPVARIDLDHRRPRRGLVRNQHARRDAEGLLAIGQFLDARASGGSASARSAFSTALASRLRSRGSS